eukprot:4510226-Pyramimonas_sp.AAC.1
MILEIRRARLDLAGALRYLLDRLLGAARLRNLLTIQTEGVLQRRLGWVGCRPHEGAHLGG